MLQQLLLAEVYSTIRNENTMAIFGLKQGFSDITILTHHLGKILDLPKQAIIFYIPKLNEVHASID